MFLLRQIPSFDSIREHSERHAAAGADPSSIELWLLLLRTASDVLAEFEAFLAGHGLSQGRFIVLMLLNKCISEPATASDLADRSGMSRGAMTGVIDSLEEEGLVERTRSAEDRRSWVVKITPAGESRLDEILPGHFEGISERMGVLDEGERAQLSEQLKRFLDAGELLTADGRSDGGVSDGSA
ncbi:MAG: MarR family transcriptional regulator [Planctomycetota bacterium]